MKIFDWMHRKFHSNVDYCMVSQKRANALAAVESEKTPSKFTCETAALLYDHVTLVDVLSGWQDGILTIGTFGLDHHLNAFPGKAEYSVTEAADAVNDADEAILEQQQQQQQEEEFRPPAVISTIKQELKRVFGTTHGAGDEIQTPAAEADGTEHVRRLLLGAPEINGEDETEKEEKKKKGERTTLADLFSADADAAAAASVVATAEECVSGGPPPESGKKPPCRAKHVRSLAKKLIMWKEEESRPTRKIHRLVRKMLKRKIHPELEHEIHGTVGSMGVINIGHEVSKSGLDYDLSTNNDGNESISLLHDVVLEL